MSDIKQVESIGVPELKTISDTVVIATDFSTLTQTSDVDAYEITARDSNLRWFCTQDPTPTEGNLWYQDQTDIISKAEFDSIRWIRDGSEDALIRVQPVKMEDPEKALYLDKSQTFRSRVGVFDSVCLNGVPFGGDSGTGDVREYPVFIPMSGVTDSVFSLFGTFETEATGATGDVATAFSGQNQHFYCLINSITTGGAMVISGTAVSETTQVPVVDTETITIDASDSRTFKLYQTSKKWYEIDSINVTGGSITGIDYDYGLVGYLDFGNRDTCIVGYRMDFRAASGSGDVGLVIRKIEDAGDGKLNFFDLESIGIDSTTGNGEIVDQARSGGDSRAFTYSVNALPNNNAYCFKALDLETIFGEENCTALSSSKDEGWVVSFTGVSGGVIGQGGISGIDHATLTIYYKLV